jgi:hypothetical protein
MTTQTQQTPADNPPPVDPDAAAYAALAKELEVEEQGQQEEPAAEPAAEPVTEPAAEKPAPTEIDNLKSALREAREAHKAEQARTDAILAAMREAKERRGQQQETTAKPAEEAKLPDVQADPIGHFQGRIAQLEEALRYAYQGGQQQTQQIQVHLQEQAMWSTVQASEAAIRDPKSGEAHKPDYDDACRHLEGARIRQLDRMYPSTSPQVQALAKQAGFPDANQYKLHLLNQDRRAVATHALQTGVSPAQLYYDLALDSGYTPKPNGKAPAGQQPLAERAAQQIAAAKKGSKAAVTLSGDTGGRKGPQDMSITDLADLAIEDPEAFDKAWNDMQRAGKLG